MTLIIIKPEIYTNPYSYQFDGINEFIRTNSNLRFDWNKPFSICFLFRPVTNTFGIFGNFNNGTAPSCFNVRYSFGYFECVAQAKGATNRMFAGNNTSSNSVGNWTFLTMASPGDGVAINCKWYINGIDRNSYSYENTLKEGSMAGGSFCLLGRSFEEAASGFYSNGYLNQLYVCQGALSLAQHQTQYNNGKPLNPRRIKDLIYCFDGKQDTFDGTNYNVIDYCSNIVGRTVNMEEGDRVLHSPY